MYNTIAYSSIVIGALALVAFHVRLFGSAILKENYNSINKRKTQLFSSSFNVTCKIRRNCNN
jgi:hypothetical protein